MEGRARPRPPVDPGVRGGGSRPCEGSRIGAALGQSLCLSGVDAEKDGAQWAKPKDARITPLGHVLRKTRLDELPQLINIFKGEMSLVGPRPERPEIIEKSLAPNIPFFGLRHLVKPGVTGWAQVTFRYGFSQEDSKEKLQFDLFYVKNRSVWLDMLVIIKTIKTVITGAGQ